MGYRQGYEQKESEDYGWGGLEFGHGYDVYLF